jgi:hypothetical protein
MSQHAAARSAGQNEDPTVIQKILTHLKNKATSTPAGLPPEGRAPPGPCH